MFKWLKKLISKILDTIKKLFDKVRAVLGPLMPFIIIGLMVFAGPIGASLTGIVPTWITGALEIVGAWEATTAVVVGLGTSAMLFPDETSEAVSKIADVAVNVADGVGDAVGTAVGSTVGSVLSTVPSYVWWIVAAAVSVYLFVDNNDSDTKTILLDGYPSDGTGHNNTVGSLHD